MYNKLDKLGNGWWTSLQVTVLSTAGQFSSMEAILVLILPPFYEQRMSIKHNDKFVYDVHVQVDSKYGNHIGFTYLSQIRPYTLFKRWYMILLVNMKQRKVTGAVCTRLIL